MPFADWILINSVNIFFLRIISRLCRSFFSSKDYIGRKLMRSWTKMSIVTCARMIAREAWPTFERLETVHSIKIIRRGWKVGRTLRHAILHGVRFSQQITRAIYVPANPARSRTRLCDFTIIAKRDFFPFEIQFWTAKKNIVDSW